ncbi:hypothetical protein [Actinocrispum wychmicini]|uniref:Uncharacterized protein n=1 Tax=Actinocrispum wychmicini TaxID=1213861 RepID=A0A4R2JTP5_9PSEU|nr:hypothetical protein [Actinocrispum wychmicini]TCO60658.1 hypothetical protein EV192_103233 [Actinocrispum wychmicini]
MGQRSNDQGNQTPGVPDLPIVLSPRAIRLYFFAVLALGAVFAVVFLFAYGLGETDASRAQNQLNAIKTGGAVIIALGGALVLNLGARRQQTNEIMLWQKARDQSETLRASAVEQLGSDKAYCQIAGIHALKELAKYGKDQKDAVLAVLKAFRHHVEAANVRTEVDKAIVDLDSPA